MTIANHSSDLLERSLFGKDSSLSGSEERIFMIRDLVRQATLWDEGICLDCFNRDEGLGLVCGECGGDKILLATTAQALITILDEEGEEK